jgi:hypothetical protein
MLQHPRAWIRIRARFLQAKLSIALNVGPAKKKVPSGYAQFRLGPRKGPINVHSDLVDAFASYGPRRHLDPPASNRLRGPILKFCSAQASPSSRVARVEGFFNRRRVLAIELYLH